MYSLLPYSLKAMAGKRKRKLKEKGKLPLRRSVRAAGTRQPNYTEG